MVLSSPHRFSTKLETDPSCVGQAYDLELLIEKINKVGGRKDSQVPEKDE
jgi:hypothetical protein